MDVTELKTGDEFLFDGRAMVFDDSESYHGFRVVRMSPKDHPGMHIEIPLPSDAAFAERAAPMPKSSEASA